jgi:hypothetical protein
MEDGNSVLRICLFFLKGGSLLRNMLLTAGNVEYRTLNFETCLTTVKIHNLSFVIRCEFSFVSSRDMNLAEGILCNYVWSRIAAAAQMHQLQKQSAEPKDR